MNHTISRKAFLRYTGVLGGGAMLNATPAMALMKSTETRVTILHTNDWHSRIEPFPSDGGSLSGMGGAAIRAQCIEQIRAENKHVLLLDAGDIFQGTPYFNFFGGELEYKLMSDMRYDCVTLGNHDFDNGLQGLERQQRHAGFSIVNCNYDFTGTSMERKVVPYRIYRKGNIRIGVFGLGIELMGLVPDRLYGKVKFLDPVASANRVAAKLKFESKCDLVICLSHLGFEYRTNKISDLVLAKKSNHIDLILGGHTHTFLPEPVIEKNADNREVVINQVGWAGVRLGQIDYVFNPFSDKTYRASSAVYSLGSGGWTRDEIRVDNQL